MVCKQHVMAVSQYNFIHKISLGVGFGQRGLPSPVLTSDKCYGETKKQSRGFRRAGSAGSCNFKQDDWEGVPEKVAYDKNLQTIKE